MRCLNPVPRFSVVRRVAEFYSRYERFTDLLGFNSHICGNIIQKMKVQCIYTGKNHRLLEHPYCRQVQRKLRKENHFSLFLQCFLGKQKMTTNYVAKFIPASLSRRPDRHKSDLTRLEVTPQGHDCLDDIVISVLIVERIRTSPSVLKDMPSSMLKELL